MILILMRHGIAEDAGPDLDDAARELTANGQKRVRDMAAFLGRMKLLPTHYASSPRVRAMQTASIVRKELERGRKPVALTSLDFNGNWREFVAEVGELIGGEDDAIVLAAGHEPCCGEFLTQALLPMQHSVPFGKGAIAGLRWKGPIADREAELLFCVTSAAVKNFRKR